MTESVPAILPATPALPFVRTIEAKRVFVAANARHARACESRAIPAVERVPEGYETAQDRPAAGAQGSDESAPTTFAMERFWVSPPSPLPQSTLFHSRSPRNMVTDLLRRASVHA